VTPAVCDVQTPPGAVCTWPGVVAAGIAYGQGYERIYGVVALSPPNVTAPDYYVDPGNLLPAGWTWSFVTRFTAPGEDFPYYSERLLIDLPTPTEVHP
jgi:hypothetical protein